MKVIFELVNKYDQTIGKSKVDIPEMHPLSIRSAMKKICYDYTECAAIRYEFPHNGITIRETVEKLYSELA